MEDENNVQGHERAPKDPFPASVFLRIVAPALLFAMAGVSAWLFGGPAFAIGILVIASSHTAGHYFVARRFGVTVSPPYFVPQTAIGIAGAFVKIKWPVTNRLALARIFLAGPLLGIGTSIVILLLGLPQSTLLEEAADNAILLGEPLLFQFAQKLILPGVGEDQEIVLSGLAFAGWAGVVLNFWHLLPIGRFDGGRLVVALWGYRAMLWISWLTIVAILSLSLVLPHYAGLATMGALSLIGIKKQYLERQSAARLRTIDKVLSAVFFLLIVLCFNAEPFKLLP